MEKYDFTVGKFVGLATARNQLEALTAVANELATLTLVLMDISKKLDK